MWDVSQRRAEEIASRRRPYAARIWPAQHALPMVRAERTMSDGCRPERGTELDIANTRPVRMLQFDASGTRLLAFGLYIYIMCASRHAYPVLIRKYACLGVRPAYVIKCFKCFTGIHAMS